MKDGMIITSPTEVTRAINDFHEYKMRNLHLWSITLADEGTYNCILSSTGFPTIQSKQARLIVTGALYISINSIKLTLQQI